MPKSLISLIEAFRMMPGVGRKTAQRYAYAFLELDKEKQEVFLKSINDSSRKIMKCKKCNSYSENEVCDICDNDKRNTELLCIVEEPKDIYILEEMGSYDGLYFVLNGLISLDTGLDFESLGINKLIQRIKEEKIKEVVLAIKSGIEGETTGLYIKTFLEDEGVKITKFASGLPMGTDIEYLDFLTLERAFEERTKI